ncbi:hypothetical protein [Pseudofrankia inefficax]|uniref:Uncharacterized protein n=1 Tax=Pseudofrankia inefficax (strain DSM 45817 / CECT 9037 / DDB 130130 / EuI1c) TaxID=298654 RepID=E3IW10_PSEI1|nr:hypothetical protein [Pseudofrankia inefficax]ADP84938.1 hypothetical protein FraEuI1c_6971 [Pseudofrankia inefficax]
MTAPAADTVDRGGTGGEWAGRREGTPYGASRRSTSVRVLAALAWLEARRYVSNPLFVVGLALTGLMMYSTLRHPISDLNGLHSAPAMFLGVFGIAIGFRLSQALDRTAETLAVTPTPAPVRTAAMSLAALVPFVFGVGSLLALVVMERLRGPAFGVFGPADQVTILAGQVAVSALGGPLLGIAVARWARTLWVLPVVVVAIGVWIFVVTGLAYAYPGSLLVAALRLFAPYAYFFDSPGGEGQVTTWRGSPEYFLGWQLALCGLTFLTGLVRGATGPARRRLLGALGVLLLTAAALFILAFTGGLGHALVTYPDGHTRPW